jgi:hypothetical protein
MPLEWLWLSHAVTECFVLDPTPSFTMAVACATFLDQDDPFLRTWKAWCALQISQRMCTLCKILRPPFERVRHSVLFAFLFRRIRTAGRNCAALITRPFLKSRLLKLIHSFHLLLIIVEHRPRYLSEHRTLLFGSGHLQHPLHSMG